MYSSKLFFSCWIYSKRHVPLWTSIFCPEMKRSTTHKFQEINNSDENKEEKNQCDIRFLAKGKPLSLCRCIHVTYCRKQLHGPGDWLTYKYSQVKHSHTHTNQQKTEPKQKPIVNLTWLWLEICRHRHEQIINFMTKKFGKTGAFWLAFFWVF